MAAYGKGQMLGSGINPESFKQDFSGFADAAKMQAQGLSNLGQSIGGAIQDYGEVKKEQKKVDAYNKASAKSIEAAITLGKSYQIKGVEETLSPFLKSYNDPNLSPIEKAALLDEGKAMIPNVFGRFDKSQAMLIEQAQNAPAPAAPFAFTGSELKKTDKGDLYVLKGNDGLDYDPKTKLPIYDLTAYGEGLPPEVFSAGAIPAVNPIDGALDMFPNFDGTPGSMPPVGTPNPLLSPITPEAQAAMNSILAAGQLAPQVGEPPASIAQPQPAPQYTPRYIAADEASAKEEEVKFLTNEQKRIYGLDVDKPFAAKFAGNRMITTPEVPRTAEETEDAVVRNIRLNAEAKAFYDKGDRAGALNTLRGLKAEGFFGGDLTDEDLDEYFRQVNPVSAAPATPTPVVPVAPAARRPIDQVIPIKK